MDRATDSTGTYAPAEAYERYFAGRAAVAAVFADRAQAERAIDELKRAGFTREQIGVAMRDRTAQGEMAQHTGTHAADGAAAGLIGGGLLGALAGFLIATGALAIPGIGPVVAGGVLAHALGIAGGTAVAGAGIGAAAGGILGALIGMGIPEHEARHVERGFVQGGTIVTVAAPARAGEAAAVLERNGGETGMALSGLAASSTMDSAAASPVPRARTVETTAGLPEAQGYVVQKRIVNDTQTIQVPVTREEYVVQRPDGTVVEIVEEPDTRRAA
jgi:hypothetical protein